MTMGIRLHLFIASDHVRLDLLQRVRSTGLRMAGQQCLAYFLGKDRGYFKVVGTQTVTGAVDATTLSATVQQALRNLARSSGRPLAGSALEVELGPQHARVGLLEIDATNATRLAPADLQTYAHAWVTHSWGLDPAAHVVRCNPLKNGRQNLLVCVDQFIPEQLSQLCLQQQLKFIDCKPALVVALSRLPAPTENSVTVLVENSPGGVRSRIAQFVVMDPHGPLSISRIWMGASDPAQQDTEIAQWTHRLCAQHHIQRSFHVDQHAWPSPVDAPVQGSGT